MQTFVNVVDGPKCALFRRPAFRLVLSAERNTFQTQRDALTTAYTKLLATALNEEVESAHVCFQTDVAENIA